MENATKALLIAAAILIAILIISLGIVVYRMAAETVGSVNLSEAEMAAFNGKFTAYEGEKVSTERLITLFKVVITHNQQEEVNGTKRYVKVTNPRGATIISEITTKLDDMPSGSRNFKIQCKYKNGLVNEIKFNPI